MMFILEINLTEIKDGAYIISRGEYSDIGTHWVVLYVNNNDYVTNFGSFGVEHIPKEIKIFINNKNIKTNIFRIQTYDLIMCIYFCIGFIDFIMQERPLLNLQIFFHQKTLRKMMI